MLVLLMATTCDALLGATNVASLQIGNLAILCSHGISKSRQQNPCVLSLKSIRGTAIHCWVQTRHLYEGPAAAHLHNPVAVPEG